jgi:uncharacterized protein YbaP (TraB family)
MKRRLLLHLLVPGFLLVILVHGLALQAQVATAPKATEKPFLWRVDGAVPSYLYGTIHVPDSRVLELPEVVKRALDASDVFEAEIPLDDQTQAGMVSKVMLPPGQDLRKIAGDEVFNRIVRVLNRGLAGKLPNGAGDLLASTLAPMRPWAAMSQLELVEYLPDMINGREPLDVMLYGMASKAGKEVAGIETVDEQVAVFDSFTTEEQVDMLKATLDEIEKPPEDGVSPLQKLVQKYLAGDLNPLAAELEDQGPTEEALRQKIETRVVTNRNLIMADRIGALLAQKPAKSYFIAVGALHYAGDTGLISQLTKKGFKITRLTPADASTIVVHKPAA